MTTLFLLGTVSSYAAAITDEEAITVTATGNERQTFDVPAMVSVVDNDSPYTLTATTAGNLLSGIAGIVRDGVGRTNGQTFTMRGYDKSGVLVMVDGVRQNNGMAISSATFLDPALIKRVEVVRGPVSSLYGSGGLGGVIDYQTVNASDLLSPEQNYGIRLFSAAASGDHSLGAGMTMFGRMQQFDGVVSAVQRKRGDIYQSDGENAPDREKPASLFAKGSWRPDSAQTVGASVRMFTNTAKEPGNPTLTRSSAEGADHTRRTTQKDAQLNYELRPEGMEWLSLRSRFYSSQVDMRSRPDGSAAEWRHSTTHGMTLVNHSNLQGTLAGHQLIYGVEYYQQRQKPSGATTLYPDGRINFVSGLLQDEVTLRALPASLIIGTRYDHYQSRNPQHGELTASRWSPKAALNITPTSWLMLFGSVSSAFRAPTMEEMYRDGVHFYRRGQPNYWVPNLNLQPETNMTREVGAGISLDSLLFNEDTLQLKASYFSTEAKNYIATRVDRQKMRSYSWNVHQARIRGWDMQGSYASRYFDWQLSWNRTEGMDARNREWLSSINPDTVVSDVKVPLGGNGLVAGWRGAFVAPAHKTRANNEQQSGYAIHALAVSYRPSPVGQGLTASLVLDNVFNKQAYSAQGLPLPGRSAGLFLSYQW